MTNMNCKNEFSFKWINHIKSTLDNTGFSWIWNAQDLDIDSFKSIFKQRCSDMFIQQWQADMAQNSQCSSYTLFKNSFEVEDYWKKIEPIYAINIAKFRTRTHHLPVTKNRFHDTKDIKCTLCNSGNVGDEIHYLFICDYFASLRQKMLPPNAIYLNSFNYHELFKQDEHHLKNLSKFVKEIMSKFKCES